MNPTIQRFGYPENLLKEFTFWVVLLRPAQATLGSLVMAYKGDATRAGDLPTEAWTEVSTVTREIEATLSHHFPMEKLNYLMLMMVDLEVHQHVIPRYSGEVRFDGVTFSDPGWPGAPQLGHAAVLADESFQKLANLLREEWVMP